MYYLPLPVYELNNNAMQITSPGPKSPQTRLSACGLLPLRPFPTGVLAYGTAARSLSDKPSANLEEDDYTACI